MGSLSPTYNNLGTAEAREEARAFFRTLDPSEQRRLVEFFRTVFSTPPPLPPPPTVRTVSKAEPIRLSDAELERLRQLTKSIANRRRRV